MAVSKLSAIASAGSPPASTDTVIGVGGGTTDYQYTLAQIATSIVPAGANPSATAGPAAVNGSATTFMRSDGAPLIQKASASQFGIVEVDNTTITAASGVISAVKLVSGIEFVADGGGSVLTTGVKGYLEIPFGATINRVTLL